MASQSKLSVLVPSGEKDLIGASGKIGPTPDTWLLGNFRQFRASCRRSHLPNCLKELTFAYTRPTPLGSTQPDTVPNFLCLDDFFIVTEEIKAFFERRLAGAFESAPIRLTKGEDGPAMPGYSAIKIARTIDCIDPNRSYATQHVGAKPKQQSFSELTYRCELADELVHEFANAPGGRYVSYPFLYWVKNIHILAERIPQDAMIFQPAFWPGVLFVHNDFAKDLAQICSGGTPGYYFWTIDTEDVSGSYHKTWTAFR